MTDFSDHDFQKLIDALYKNTEANARLSNAYSARRPSKITSSNTSHNDNDNNIFKKISSKYKEKTNNINEKIDNIASHFKILGGSAQDLIIGFNGLVKNIVGGTAISQLIEIGVGLTKTYNDLTNVGQQFGGSVLEMANQAAEAGLPLSEFARLLEKNSTAAAILLQQNSNNRISLGQLSQSVRNTTKQFGFYGMSVEQIDNLTGDYVESMRIQNRVSEVNRITTSAQISSFAKDITDFSVLTGKSRKQIAEDTMEAMKNPLAASVQMSTQAQEAATKAYSFLSAIGGPFGKELAGTLADTIGFEGNSFFTELGKEAISAGVPELNGFMENIYQKVMRGKFDTKDQAAALEEFQSMYKEHGEAIRRLASINPSVKNLLSIFQSANSISSDRLIELEKQADKEKSLTQFLTTLEQNLNQLGSWFNEGILSQFKDFDTEFPSTINGLSGIIKDAGIFIGKVLKETLKPENVKVFVTIIESFVTAIGDAFNAVKFLFNPSIKGLKDGVDSLKSQGILPIIAVLILFGGKLAKIITSLVNFSIRVSSLFKAGTVRINSNIAEVFANKVTGSGAGNIAEPSTTAEPTIEKNTSTKAVPKSNKTTKLGRFLDRTTKVFKGNGFKTGLAAEESSIMAGAETGNPYAFVASILTPIVLGILADKLPSLSNLDFNPTEEQLKKVQENKKKHPFWYDPNPFNWFGHENDNTLPNNNTQTDIPNIQAVPNNNTQTNIPNTQAIPNNINQFQDLNPDQQERRWEDLANQISNLTQQQRTDILMNKIEESNKLLTKLAELTSLSNQMKAIMDRKQIDLQSRNARASEMLLQTQD